MRRGGSILTEHTSALISEAVKKVFSESPKEPGPQETYRLLEKACHEGVHIGLNLALELIRTQDVSA